MTDGRVNGVKITWAMLAAVCVSGCAHPPTRPNWARLGNTSSEADADDFHRNPHHQYYDKSHNLFYYYDPVQKRFFWENGQPKD